MENIITSKEHQPTKSNKERGQGIAWPDSNSLAITLDDWLLFSNDIDDDRYI